jgi:hypothetical protein
MKGNAFRSSTVDWCVLVRSYAFDEDIYLLARMSEGVLKGLALLSMLLLF